MKKIIDLIAGAGSGKDEKLLNYVRKNYLINNSMTNLCFINGQEDEQGNHIQMSAEELRKIKLDMPFSLKAKYLFEKNNIKLKGNTLDEMAEELWQLNSNH